MRAGAVGVVLWLASGLPPGEARDPFRPPGAACAREWHGWRYGGQVAGEEGVIALVQSPDGRWQRLEPGAASVAGWRVSTITRQALVLAHDGECGTQQLAWMPGAGRQEEE